MKIGIAQINPTLGDLNFNRKLILDQVRRARELDCDLVVTPESALLGYHPFDLLERPEVISQQMHSFKQLVRELPAGISALVGLITFNPNKRGRPYYNSAALITRGKKPRFFHKQLLPTGDVFDEARFIEKGRMKDNFFSFQGKRILLTICEDIWAWPDKSGRSFYRENPLAALPKRPKIDLILNMSASPYYPNKFGVRRSLVAKTAKHFRAPMLYCNLVGAQDEIVFDGQSFGLNPKGQEILRCLPFQPDLGIFDLHEGTGSRLEGYNQVVDELHAALVLGIRDFCRKTGFERVHLGLSGGIDSALVAALAVDALGPNRVTCFFLPSDYTSSLSRDLANQIAQSLRVELIDFSITKSYQALRTEIDNAFGIQEFGLIHENLQARVRGLLLMAHSNYRNSLLLGTSNKSELAAGYATLYGDLCGGLLPIGDLTKQQVRNLCQYYNREAQILPEEVISREPSAELRPNQKDEDSLPPYAKLDAAVRSIVEKNLKASNETERWLLKALFRSEFKRWQAPPILKVSAHSFGRGRRLPVAVKFTGKLA